MSQTTDLPSTDDAEEEIFLSPRVLDMTAFQDLEARLRKLIGHALETGKALVSLDEKAQDSMAALQEAEPAIDDRARSAATLLATLDERVSAAETILGKAIERAERAESFEGDVERTIARAEQVVAERIDGLVAEAERRIAARQAEQEARLTEHADSLRSAIEGDVDRARNQIDHARSTLTKIRREAEEAAAALAERIDLLRSEADNLRTPMLELLNDLCERAEALLGCEIGEAERPGAPARGSMRDLLQRAESLEGEASGAIERLERVRDQTEQARVLLGKALAASVSQIDALADKRRSLHAEIERAGAESERARAGISETVDELRRAVAEPMRCASSESDRLRELVEQAATARDEARRASEQHAASLERVEQALARLEPWRAVLMEERDDLPPALQVVVRRVRDEIGADMGRIAEGLQAIARRAENVRTEMHDEPR